MSDDPRNQNMNQPPEPDSPTADEETRTAEPTPDGQTEPHTADKSSAEKKKSNRKASALGMALIAFAIVAIAVGAALIIPRANINDFPNDSLSGYSGVDGRTYLLGMDGKVITLPESTDSATMTPDRRHIVYTTGGGTLYVTDGHGKNRRTLSEGPVDDVIVRNDGVVFRCQDRTHFRMHFTDDIPQMLGRSLDVLVAEHSLSVLYATNVNRATPYAADGQSGETGSVYLLPADAADPVRLDTCKQAVRLEAVSDDGLLALWTLNESVLVPGAENEKNPEDNLGIRCTIRCTDNGSSVYTLTEKSEYGPLLCESTRKQDLWIFAVAGDDRLYVKEAGKDLFEVKMGAPLAYQSGFYTEKGMIRACEDRKDVKTLYVMTDSSAGLSHGEPLVDLYAILPSGNREQVLFAVRRVTMANGQLIYIDDRSDLHTAEVKGIDLDRDVRVTSSVSPTSVTLSPNGRYAYFSYLEGYNGNTRTVYVCKVGEKHVERVAENVYLISGTSVTGDTLYYFRNMNVSSAIPFGTLCSWTYGNDEPDVISTDVAIPFVTSGKLSGSRLAVVRDLTFLKYKYVDRENGKNTYVFDWIYYNGKKSVIAVEDIGI